jgi:site-specific recombinase XerD
MEPRPGLLQVARSKIRSRHLSYRTEVVYLHWIRRLIRFHGRRHPREMGAPEVEHFLTHLAVDRKVSASTQNQALQAILFLYRQVLEVELPWLDNITRAQRSRHLPVVLSRAEVSSLLAALDGVYWLIGGLLYGGGLRLSEALRLRVKDLVLDRGELIVRDQLGADHRKEHWQLVLDRGELIVRDGKGGKDRVTVIAENVIPVLRGHLARLHEWHVNERRHNRPGVSLPNALARKYPNAATQWGWQYVFPSANLCRDPYSGHWVRHHLHEKSMQRVMQNAVRKAGIVQPASCHTLRHCFATHLLEDGYDIRTVQELLGHSDVKTTMIYTHVMRKGAKGVKSPLDRQ